ncbi:hypothetical protein EF910_32620 [Streptomyces sp. WAC07149]|uniref:DUF6183 family protein n=1 Tax=Streptomyces sp. WAC07149 TaxID=2487425 RepID=UPI000F78EB47|nr:DUF6183 family protein [Streptomyces sp. WAC07149]RST00173.1 hypothetical protein EF910_32620 [Streptomyces sp. WAC07149]
MEDIQFAPGEPERRAADGDFAYVREMGARLADGYEEANRRARTYQEQLARVVRVLALTPGPESLAELMRLVDDKRLPTHPRELASLLAEHQRPADLAAAVFRRPGSWTPYTLEACLFHELLLRGVDVRDFPPPPSSHPLSWLPVRRRDFEAGARFPTRSLDGGSGGCGTAMPTDGRVDPPVPRTTERSALRNAVTVEEHEALLSAPHSGDWGHCDAWVFPLDGALAPERVPALLPALPMPCTDVGATARFEVALSPLEDVWQLLFAAASMGGVYTGGVYGAWGRRWAWCSMAALSGAPVGADAEEVERRARETTWFRFEADSGWFHNEIGADFGIAALSPDRRRLAVLAATDTD